MSLQLCTLRQSCRKSCDAYEYDDDDDDDNDDESQMSEHIIHDARHANVMS